MLFLFLFRVFSSACVIKNFYVIMISSFSTASALSVCLIINRASKVIFDIPLAFLAKKTSVKFVLMLSNIFTIIGCIFMYFKNPYLSILFLSISISSNTGKYETAVYNLLKEKLNFKKTILAAYFVDDLIIGLASFFLKDVSQNFLITQSIIFSIASFFFVKNEKNIEVAEKTKVRSKITSFVILFATSYAFIFTIQKLMQVFLISENQKELAKQFTYLFSFFVSAGCLFFAIILHKKPQFIKKLNKIVFFLILLSGVSLVVFLFTKSYKNVVYFSLFFCFLYPYVEVFLEERIESSQDRLMQISISTTIANLIRLIYPVLFLINYDKSMIFSGIIAVNLIIFVILVLKVKNTNSIKK